MLTEPMPYAMEINKIMYVMYVQLECAKVLLYLCISLYVICRELLSYCNKQTIFSVSKKEDIFFLQGTRDM